MYRSTATLGSSNSPSSTGAVPTAAAIATATTGYAERRAQRFAELADRTKFDDSDLKNTKSTSSDLSSSSLASGYPRYNATSPGSSPYHPQSYRYASLDRLGQRNKIYNSSAVSDVSGSNQNLTSSSNDVSPTSVGKPVSSNNLLGGPKNTSSSTSNATVAAPSTARATSAWTADRSQTSNLSSKRELFFKQDAPASTATATSTATNGTVGSSSTTTSSSLSNSRENILNSAGNKEKDSYSSVKERESSSSKDKEKVTSSSQYSMKSVDGYVGFANLPNQVYRKAVKRGFDFTLMVVGESGLGKSTLINSMFLTDIYAPDYPGPSHRIKKTVQVETTKIMLKENGVNLTLTVVDTPGFGDAVDNSNCWQPIIDYIESKYEDYLNSESRVNRKMISDSRVHCCLYFIAPSGHGLKPLDIEFMKRLHDKVNIIPLISKADTMTPEECALFKKTILNEIAQHKIKIYEFPDCDDEEDNKVQKPLRERVPFAVVGSNTIIDSNGKKVRGRKYPWGSVEVENLEHCDFIALRNMLIRTHMQDLKEVANNVHYENFRCRKLAGVSQNGKMSGLSNKNPLAQMEDERKEHEDKMKKMEQEMENVFEMKVKEKKQKLKDSETDLQRRHEQMKKSLEQQQKELDDRKKHFLKEKETFEIANKDLEEIYRKSNLENSKDSLDGKEKKKEKKKGLF